MLVEVKGRVFSGIGKGRYYVGHEEYQKRFRQALGYAPYPGTLNLKIEDSESVERLYRVRSSGGVKIDGFKAGSESFSSLSCVGGEMRGQLITLLFIDVTHYNESVVELISPVYLRGKLGLRDGDLVTFTVDVPTPPRGMR